ncbi:DUF6504 family protein [Caldithrix abyssi]|uniref:DUF6504 domain-containing protein n=1 Tax=Caldithrix abyssi DSM 13497 TaxID=880073 RepID=H1XUW1_CALAY|nr:DUF6504 family protein [Caldithrix abyssi]APF17565.1 hypothetical protein Cabys_814 [Caldithrix abyssi DSM 13497]EHO41660.1 hypothetical protein Calab_2048 [Caldithrix abyssi DSM 13497]
MKEKKMIFAIVEVVTYDGGKKAERPLRFVYEGKTYLVAQVIDRWYEGHPVAGRPNYNYFKVLTTDGEIYILRYNQRYEVWSMLIKG